MDALTQRLLDEEREMAEHPERYKYVEVCDQCGGRTERPAPKAEIEKGRLNHPECAGRMLEIGVGLCDACAAKEPRDED